MRFRDRRHAGELLGAELADLHPPDPVVYGLPRGGMPVAFEVAKTLACPLDVLVVRKVGVPYQPELAMGAIGEGEVVVRNEDVLDLARIDEAAFQSAVSRETKELVERVEAYRTVAEPISPDGHAGVVVDDGLATGSTALAAMEVLKKKGAAEVWLAVPVAPDGSLGDLEQLADRMVILSRPHGFGAVGVWYQDFSQTEDQEVRALLAESRLA
jgi:putative phosphoribosyl transferase